MQLSQQYRTGISIGAPSFRSEFRQVVSSEVSKLLELISGHISDGKRSQALDVHFGIPVCHLVGNMIKHGLQASGRVDDVKNMRIDGKDPNKVTFEFNAIL